MSILGPLCPDADGTTPSHRTPAVGAVRFAGLSFRTDRRVTQICLVLIVGILIVGTISISVGDFPVPLSEVVPAILGDSNGEFDFVVRTLRLPRVLTGIGVGAAFGVSGALFQSLVRNPLGSPDIIGFNSGASFGAVLSIIYLDGNTWVVSTSALAGGLATALLVYVVAWNNGVKAYRLVLVGIGAAFMLSAAVDFMLTRGEITDVQRAAVWLTGSLNGRTWSHVLTVWCGLAFALPIILAVRGWLERLELGDDAAAALGLKVRAAKLGLVLAGVVLAALGVAVAGPVAFVAFVSGPIARRLCRSGGACLIPAGFVGSWLVVAADLGARRAFAPVEVPVGVLTAVIGAPYLLWLLRKQSRTGVL